MSEDRNRDPVIQARRILDDLRAFEGDVFIVPEGVHSVRSSTVPVTASLNATVPLEAFSREICECQCCVLGKTRKNFVFGSGNPDAGIMFIGEAPGADEDAQGQPFVGKAGQLLTKIIEAMGMHREEVYICNVLKCRPPGNRDPNPEEIATCEPYLKRQIDFVQPKIICTLGRISTQALLKTSAPMRSLRGMLHEYEGIPLIATYHPAALLRNPDWKRGTWEDIKWLRREYDGVQL